MDRKGVQRFTIRSISHPSFLPSFLTARIGSSRYGVELEIEFWLTPTMIWCAGLLTASPSDAAAVPGGPRNGRPSDQVEVNTASIVVTVGR